mmetsp:Transcript_721/g.2681  ORF Transcript_721/g.2681 Transcript_721/m.2681 type:complete len:214 (-) Transcript_721:4012-4653(-)|eukprot:scaffold1393_cov343-Prasinococcus_capsulatus_cf.AAC.5
MDSCAAAYDDARGRGQPLFLVAPGLVVPCGATSWARGLRSGGRQGSGRAPGRAKPGAARGGALAGGSGDGGHGGARVGKDARDHGARRAPGPRPACAAAAGAGDNLHAQGCPGAQGAPLLAHARGKLYAARQWARGFCVVAAHGHLPLRRCYAAAEVPSARAQPGPLGLLLGGGRQGHQGHAAFHHEGPARGERQRQGEGGSGGSQAHPERHG